MRVTIKPRFFIILIVLGVGGLVLLFNSIRSKEEVLGSDTYALKEPDSTSKNFGTGGGSIADYQEITISHTVKQGETLYSIADIYHADPQTILDYPYNEIPDDLSLTLGQILIIPNGWIDPPAGGLPDIPIAQGSGRFIWPIQQAQGKPAHGVVTQHAFWWHPGAIDIGIDLGTPIRAADSGKVIKVERYKTGYGLHAVIDHGNGLTSLYAHLSDIRVNLSENISKGEIIGLSGSTGRSTGPHLHFELKQNGNPIDPMTLL